MELKKIIDDNVYNALYTVDDRTREDPRASPYWPLFNKAADRLLLMKVQKLLEVGCGSGTLAQIVLDRSDISYCGFDVSAAGIENAKSRQTRGTFFVASATDAAAYNCEYDSILSCEVLEHISDDRGAIALWRKGTRVVCSVPNFDYPTHYRLFFNEDDIAQRYGDLIDIQNIERIAKPIFPHRTIKSYLGSLRWAAANGNYRRVAGLMGIRKFDWHAGWFLFSGVKK
jgi:2-polyprenyl-3-methyl-5-hydroxy-6-metoxy-1,4-benzoquinol methylase